MTGPAIGRLQGSPRYRPLCHRGGGVSGERGGDTWLICITARRVRRGLAVLVPGVGSDLNLRRQHRGRRERRRRPRSAEAEGAAAHGGTQRRRYGAFLSRRERPGSGNTVWSAAPRGGGTSAHAPGLQLCTRTAAGSHTDSQARRSYAGAAWEHVTRLQCRRRRACAVPFSRRGGSRWDAGCGVALSFASPRVEGSVRRQQRLQVGLTWGRVWLGRSSPS